MTVQRNLLIGGFAIFLLTAVVFTVSADDGDYPQGRFLRQSTHFYMDFGSVIIYFHPFYSR
jgi:hypothetical protein